MSLEELEVAEEELIEQNQQLTESCAALEAERQRYIDLFEFAPDGYLVTDDRGKIKEANRAACDMIGGQARFLVGKPLSSFIDKQYLKTFRSELNRIKAASDVREMDLRLSPRDGPPFRAFIRVFASRIPDGKPSDFRWLLRDITKQKEADITDRNQAETSLRESQKQLASIIGSAMDAIITIDDDQRVVLFNAAAEEMFRCPADAAVGQPLDSFIPERFRSSYREHIRGFREASIISLSMGSDRAILGLRANGEEFPIEASISQVEVGSKKLLTVIIRDITSRRQAEDKLREQAALLDQAQDAIMVRDLEDHILFWSKGAERIYGWAAEEAVGKHIQDLHYKTIGQDYYEAKQSLLERGYWSSEGIHRTKNDNEIVVENRWSLLRDQEGNPESVLVINTDITEKKRLEEQFLRAQRMESIGMLAAGIAHDLGNIL
ncbi:MAG TPA: PAS domain S-box protein, partial [Blastocatellia bacterium]|nr:PAS domain S-box protein [Blastocatellia bacterium]